jgi:hypothetical protein
MHADMSVFQFHATIRQGAISIARTGRRDVFAPLGLAVTTIKVQPNAVTDWDGQCVIDLSSNPDQGRRIGGDFRATDITDEGDRSWLG